MQKKNEVRLFDLFPHFKGNEETKNPLPTWKKVHSDVLMARKMHSSVLLKNFIVILGGVNYSDSLFLFDHIVLFDLENNKSSLISTSGEIPIPRTKNSRCALSENEIIIFGGEFEKDNLTNDVHKLTIDFNKNPVTAKWEAITTNPVYINRKCHSANIYQNKMYTFSGVNTGGVLNNQLWCLDFETCHWAKCKTSGELPNGRRDYFSLITHDKLFIIGGIGKNGSFESHFNVLCLKTMIWSTIKSDIQLISKRHCSFVELMDGKIYIFGGFDSNNLDKIKIYDINSNEWGCLETRGTILLSNKSCFSSVCWQNNFYILGGEEKLRISGDVYSLCLDEVALKQEIPENKGKVVKYGDYEAYYSQMRTLLDKKLFTDITFIIKGQEISSHKHILATRCDYFEKLFKSEENETKDKIEITDTEINVFQAALEFIYCNEVVLTEEVAIKLLEICDKYLLSELKALCEDFLSRKITLVNYVNLSNLSEQFEANVLKNAVIKFVRQNLKKIKTSGEIADLSKAMLWDILFTYSEETESNKSPKSK